MDSVRVNRGHLLVTIKDNRDKHLDDYHEALVDWKNACVAACQKNMEILAFGADIEKMGKGLKSLPQPPKSHATEYDKAIAMLEFSVEEEIDIDAHTFNQLVLDDWAWKQSWTTANTMYKSWSGSLACE